MKMLGIPTQTANMFIDSKFSSQLAEYDSFPLKN